MLLSDIINIRTIENIAKYNINIELFDDVKTLRTHITSLRNFEYRKGKNEYFKLIMRARCRKKRELKLLM